MVKCKIGLLSTPSTPLSFSFQGQLRLCILRRTAPASPSTAVPIRIRLEGSGVTPVTGGVGEPSSTTETSSR